MVLIYLALTTAAQATLYFPLRHAVDEAINSGEVLQAIGLCSIGAISAIGAYGSAGVIIWERLKKGKDITSTINRI